MFSDNAVHLHIDIKKWLVRDYGPFSVGQSEDGRLVLVLVEGSNCEFYTYLNFRDFARNRAHFEPPNSVVRAVAHELGITHITDHGKRWEVNTYFPSGDCDPLKGHEYQPQ